MKAQSLYYMILKKLMNTVYNNLPDKTDHRKILYEDIKLSIMKIN